MSVQSEHVTRRMNKAKKYLRMFMRDTPELNRLIRDYESDDDALLFAIDMCISDWNTTTPMIRSVHIGNFPSLYLLIHGAACVLLKSAGLLQSRNELTYQSAGTSIVRSNKTSYYQSWLVNFSNEYESKKRMMKMQQNLEAGWGGVASEYDRIGYNW